MRLIELLLGRPNHGQQVADEQRTAEGEHQERQQVITQEHDLSVRAGVRSAWTGRSRCSRILVAIAKIFDTLLPMTRILRIDSSARTGDSVSRELASRLIDRFPGDTTVRTRDLSDGVPLLTEHTLLAMRTPADERTPEHDVALAVADEFIAELIDADAVVIGLPIYNFGPPAALKAWADLVARAGTTFRYTENGPEGLIDDKPVYVIVASGGVPVGSPMDLSSTWLTTFLGFLGLRNVEVVAAGQLNVDPERAVTAAHELVDDVQLPVSAAA